MDGGRNHAMRVESAKEPKRQTRMLREEKKNAESHNHHGSLARNLAVLKAAFCKSHMCEVLDHFRKEPRVGLQFERHIRAISTLGAAHAILHAVAIAVGAALRAVLPRDAFAAWGR